MVKRVERSLKLIKSNKESKSTIVNNKAWCMFAHLVIITGGFVVTHCVHASNCRVPATLCEVQTAISEATSHFSPVPPSPTLAGVSIAVTSETSLVPSVGIGPVTYNYTVTNTLRAVGANFTASFNISCLPSPSYQIYSGGAASSGSSAIAATFDTTTPGTTCPLGTASCDTPTAITLTMATANTVVTATDTNYNQVFTSTNTGWSAYVTGYYTCTYTDPNLSTAATVIVPWGQGS